MLSTLQVFATKVLRWAVISLILVCATACHPEGCTEIGCQSSFIVGFSEELSDGQYRVGVSGPEGGSSCELNVPEGGGLCESDYWGVEITVDETGITLFGAPDSVTIRITGSKSGDSVEETYLPEYEESQPNGPRCPPTCETAVDTIQAVEP